MAKKSTTDSGQQQQLPEWLQKILAASETVILWRSQIHPASYNPRDIDENERASLKRGIKTFGLIGGIVVNKQTGYTIVGGHQKVNILDEMAGYPEKDYQLKCELIDVDEKSEMEINILLNNPSAQGRWNDDKMKVLIPQIDPKRAGLTTFDLASFGVKIEVPKVQTDIAGEIKDLQSPDAALAAQKREAVKAVKQQVKEKAIATAAEHDSFITLSFTSYEAKVEFLQRFGFGPDEKFISGDVFGEMIERIDI